LVWYERHQYIQHAIEREKEIKGWLRSKKIKLIEEENPNWEFLNQKIMDWPPEK
jgi:putative endonuclease